MKRAMPLVAAVLMCCLAVAAGAGQRDLITQLASDHVDITTHFTGEQILVFGAISHRGDVIVKVTSPEQDVAISRKMRTGPIWLDGGTIKVGNTPGIMYLLASRPIGQIISREERRKYGLSLESSLGSSRLEGSIQGMEDWQDAFLRLKQGKKYYKEFDEAITVVGDRLFFANLTLPAKLPLGEYSLDIFMVRDNKVTAHQHRKLEVREVRLELWASNFATRNPWVFGVSFTLLAIAFGLTLGIVLRRANRDD